MIKTKFSINFKLNCFNNSGLKISLASPETIIKWSIRQKDFFKLIGEVTEPLTIKFKGGLPEKNGLFCERIFGPINSWFCRCSLYKKNMEVICKKCGIEFNNSIIRRYRLGFIFFKSPFFHTWYFKGPGSILSYLLEQSKENLERFIYYKDFFSNSFDNYNLNILKKLILEKNNSLDLNKLNFSHLMFISNIYQEILSKMNILLELSICRERILQEISMNERKFITKKINLLHMFFISNTNPGWIILDVLPVLPPGLRPFFKLIEGFFLTSPLNDIYRTIIMKNNRLRRWVTLRTLISPLFEISEKRMLQNILDNLFYKTKSNNKFSIIEILKGKYGRFRQNLLGKRIDFSGRSVIISGPDIIFGKIGIPFKLSLNLFKPLLLKYLRKKQTKNNLLKAIIFSQKESIYLKKFLKNLLKKQIILINRAPTLHRMNLQAFRPYIVDGESIKFFPLACTSFNADFDGDQVGIFVSLSKQSKLESKYKMSFDKNILSPLNSKNLFKPTQGIILGLYVLLMFNNKYFRGSFLYYASSFDVLCAYENNLLDLQSIFWLRLSRKKLILFNYKKISYFLITSVGRVLLNKNISIN